MHIQEGRRPREMTRNNAVTALLVAKAIDGDGWAAEQLIDMNYHAVFRMVYYRIQSTTDAEDLTQDIFFQMVKHLPRLKDQSRFRPWLFRIALNKVRDFYRKRRFLSFVGGFSDDAEVQAADDSPNRAETPDEMLMEKEFWRQFKRMGDSLPRQEREVFLLRFVDQRKIKEIAQILKKSESTVKTHLYRALKKFRQNQEFRDLLKGDQG